ncbi:integrase catalytic domain-containing protein [Trichonephila clavipes]|nr:integrase catalytic domain-containing protein [Trichonephila clavipes]
MVQEQVFLAEIKSLLSKGVVSPNSKIRNLNPFIDSDGLLRVGGRLSNSDLPYVNKHPAILPGNHNLTVQIIVHFHRKNLHTGASSLLHYVREKFWPLNGRSLCRKVVHECLVCFKSRPLVTSQLMGNLPCDRVVPDYPFYCSGVDFCGPFMISRRGKCAKLYSNNGKTFVGANKELKRFRKLIEDSDGNLAGFLSSEGIEWKFIPPRAPSFGGLWEASISRKNFQDLLTETTHKRAPRPSYYHERYYGLLADTTNTSCSLEKLRDTVHGISALHSSMLEGVRSPSPKNSYMELYQMSTQAMARKKDELDSNIHESTSDEINHKVKKKPSKKRKSKSKESSEEFIFPKKTARPVSPTSTQDPIETKNNFSDLEQDVEHPLPTVKNVNSEEITPLD